MPATIQRGTTFTNTQTNIDVATFVPLLTSATITDIDRENVKTSETVAQYSATNPASPYANEVRQGNRHGDFRSYTGGSWVTGQLGLKMYSLDSASGAVTAGDFLMPSTTTFPVPAAPGTMMKASTSTKYAWCAVATENCAPGATSMAVYHGPVRVRCSGSVVSGHAVIPSSTDALIQDYGSLGNGAGALVKGFALSADDGQGNVWIHKR